MQATHSKSTRKNSHKLGYDKDYKKIVKKSPLPMLNGSNSPEWKTLGDTFIKFSIYDENLRSIATTETSYCF